MLPPLRCLPPSKASLRGPRLWRVGVSTLKMWHLMRLCVIRVVGIGLTPSSGNKVQRVLYPRRHPCPHPRSSPAPLLYSGPASRDKNCIKTDPTFSHVVYALSRHKDLRVLFIFNFGAHDFYVSFIG